MRACEICGKPVVRRDGEAPSHHRLRRTCSVACGKALRDRLAAEATRKRFGIAIGDPYGVERYCDKCHILIPREGKPSAYRRRTCCRGCRGKAGGGPDTSRCCLACGRMLIQREDERPSDFRQRGTCGPACAEVARRATKAELRDYREMAQYCKPVDWRQVFAAQNIVPDALDGAPLRGIRPADRRTYGGVSG